MYVYLESLLPTNNPTNVGTLPGFALGLLFGRAYSLSNSDTNFTFTSTYSRKAVSNVDPDVRLIWSM